MSFLTLRDQAIGGFRHRTDGALRGYLEVMASNTLDSVLADSGLVARDLIAASGLSKRTIRRLLNRSRTASPRTQRRIVDALTPVSADPPSVFGGGPSKRAMSGRFPKEGGKVER